MKAESPLGWLLLGGMFAVLAGARVMKKGKQPVKDCASCKKPVPTGAPMCPWCRIPLIWMK